MYHHFGILLLLLATAISTSANTSPRPKVPIMGWSSWNNYRINIHENLIKSQADAMVSSGMKNAGYQFINIDDGFFGGRDANGHLLSHPTKFPGGMKAVADYIHSKGLKAGIYSDAGANTCGSIYDNDSFGIGVGLLNHEEQDLTLMLKTWGYDFIKIDWCGGQVLGLDEKTRYTEIGRIVRRLRPDAVYNVTRWQYPGDWVKYTAESWRISGDIASNFGSVMHIVDLCEPLWIHCSPGHFNDMDMLQVGRGMTTDEDKTHFTMWCMMNSPLLAGNDLTSMNQTTIDILTNPEIIALNQDTLCYQARRLRDDGDKELWAKPMSSIGQGNVAVTLLNRSSSPQTIAFDLSEIGIDASSGYSIRNLWQRQTLSSSTTATAQSFTVPGHGVVALRIVGTSTPNHPFTPPPGWSYITWASEIGLTSANNQPDADPDGDGIHNLMEYAFDGCDPLHPDSHNMTSITTTNGQVDAHFSPRHTSDIEIKPYFQYGNLHSNSWSKIVHGQNGFTYLSDHLGKRISNQILAQQRLFMRMKIDYITNVSTTPNFSFETPTLSAGTWNFASPQGWTLSGHSGGVENVNDPTRFGNSNDFGTSPNKLNGQGGLGDQVAYVNLPSASNTGSATSDVIAIIEPSTTYQVTVAFGKRSSGVGSPDVSIGLKGFFTDLGIFSTLSSSTMTTGFTDVTYTWTSPAAGSPLIGQPLRIHMNFSYDTSTGGWQQAQFDHIRFSKSSLP